METKHYFSNRTYVGFNFLILILSILIIFLVYVQIHPEKNIYQKIDNWATNFTKKH
jgi:uncharacterized protein (UPF0333 family)